MRTCSISFTRHRGDALACSERLSPRTVGVIECKAVSAGRVNLCIARVSTRSANFWGVEHGLVPQHADERLCASSDLARIEWAASHCDLDAGAGHGGIPR